MAPVRHWARRRVEHDKIPLPEKTIISSKDLSESGWEEKRQGEWPRIGAPSHCQPETIEMRDGTGSAEEPQFQLSVLLSGIITDLCFRKYPHSKRNENQHLWSVYYANLLDTWHLVSFHP